MVTSKEVESGSLWAPMQDSPFAKSSTSGHTRFLSQDGESTEESGD
jgi:hypothetical protein